MHGLYHASLGMSAVQVRGANILGLPIITTEQYPKALGSTVAELKDVLPANSPILAKTRFSMLTPDVHELLKQKTAVSQVRQRSMQLWKELTAAAAAQSMMLLLA